MARKRHGPEEIIGKLREAEVLLAKGRSVADAALRGAALARLLSSRVSVVASQGSGMANRIACARDTVVLSTVAWIE
jgi:capsular polysaccharide biosynthesis protein